MLSCESFQTTNCTLIFELQLKLHVQSLKLFIRLDINFCIKSLAILLNTFMHKQRYAAAAAIPANDGARPMKNGERCDNELQRRVCVRTRSLCSCNACSRSTPCSLTPYEIARLNNIRERLLRLEIAESAP